MTDPDGFGRFRATALRSLWRGRGFTTSAIALLALGTAATTVLFAVVNGILLRPMAVGAQDELIVAWTRMPSTGFAHHPFTVSDLDAFARESLLLRTVAGVGYENPWTWPVTEDGVTAEVRGALVSGRFFDVLEVAPLFGRRLTPDDDREGALPVLVLTHGLWQQRYGGDPHVLGRRVQLDEQTFTIVGVMPPDVEYPRGVQLWRTLSSVSPAAPFGEHARTDVDLIGRLQPDATVAQASDELAALLTRMEADAPAAVPRGLLPVVQPYATALVGDLRRPLLLLFASVGLVLLIVCANVAALQLVRSGARRGEFAVRAALGANRRQLTGPLAVESVVLAGVAGLLGIAIAWWALPLLVAFALDDLPRSSVIRMDARVVAFATIVALGTSLAATLTPAWSATSVDLMTALRRGGRGDVGTAGRQRLRYLVVAQAALALVVVAGAGLLMRSLVQLQGVDTGLPLDDLVFVRLVVPHEMATDRERHAAFLGRAIEELEALPAIAGATPVNTEPFIGKGWDVPRFAVEGQDDHAAASNPTLNLEAIHGNYFTTLGATILRGRVFSPDDRADATPVVIVTHDVAARAWPNADPIGKRIKMGGADSIAPWLTVVGVVRALHYRDLRGPKSTMYVPAEQLVVAAQSFVLRTNAPASLIAPLVRDRFTHVDARVLVRSILPFDEFTEVPLARPRLQAQVTGAFGVTALLLAALGLYAVTVAGVRQRQMEFGLRLSLGATPAALRRMVVREGLTLTMAGGVVGLLLIAAGARLLGDLLFQVRPFDPVTLVVAIGVLLLSAAVACLAPAHRATRVDPAVLLRDL